MKINEKQFIEYEFQRQFDKFVKEFGEKYHCQICCFCEITDIKFKYTIGKEVNSETHNDI